MSRRARISFILPFVDFAFMLIIIFVGMLSIAYFEPPADAPDAPKIPEIIEVRPLVTPPPPTPPREEPADSARKREIRRLRRQVEQLERQLQEETRLTPPDDREEEPVTPPAPIHPPEPSVGAHYYTDLRTRHEEE